MSAFNCSKLNKDLHFFVMLVCVNEKVTLKKWRSVDDEKILGD